MPVRDEITFECGRRALEPSGTSARNHGRPSVRHEPRGLLFGGGCPRRHRRSDLENGPSADGSLSSQPAASQRDSGMREPFDLVDRVSLDGRRRRRCHRRCRGRGCSGASYPSEGGIDPRLLALRFRQGLPIDEPSGEGSEDGTKPPSRATERGASVPAEESREPGPLGTTSESDARGEHSFDLAFVLDEVSTRGRSGRRPAVAGPEGTPTPGRFGTFSRGQSVDCGVYRLSRTTCKHARSPRVTLCPSRDILRTRSNFAPSQVGRLGGKYANLQPRRGEGIEPSKPGAARPCQF